MGALCILGMYCYLEPWIQTSLKSLKLFSIRVKELFEPIVLQKTKTKTKTKQKQKQTNKKQQQQQQQQKNNTKQNKTKQKNKETGFHSF